MGAHLHAELKLVRRTVRARVINFQWSMIRVRRFAGTDWSSKGSSVTILTLSVAMGAHQHVS